MKVLIVDDSASNQKLMRAVLEAERIEVVEAQDGVQALAVLKREPVDAIISDILMPGMDGYRLCREVRRSTRWQQLPFIFHTATYTSPEDEKLCRDLGADEYLRKPASAATVLAALREAAANGQNHRPIRAAPSSDTEIMREYNQSLVAKLEEKNEDLEKAREDLLQANHELEMRVRQRTGELTAANEALEAFAYSVSHDLRAPLRHIAGFIDVVLRDSGGWLSGINLKRLENVRSAAYMMGELIDALLELSSVSRAEIHHAPVDLSALAAEIVAELQQSELDRKVTVKVAPGLNAMGDRRLLRIVLANLLGNAWKYSGKQNDPLIEFGKIAGQEDNTYFVHDNGVGFDMTYAGRLFVPFQRLHDPADFEGTGIGLATAQRIIHRHGGTIRAESIGHQGATFYFTLERFKKFCGHSAG